MTLQTNIEVVGIKEALRELNKINPSLRRQITKDYRKILQPVITAAQNRTPTLPPLTGMDKGWTTKSGAVMLPDGGWNGMKARKHLSAKISTRRVKEFRGQLENLGTFRMVFTGLGNTVYDIAGRKHGGRSEVFSRVGKHGRRVGTVGGEQMIAVLNSRYGRGSRTVWPSFESKQNEVVEQIKKLVDHVMAQVNKRTVYGG